MLELDDDELLELDELLLELDDDELLELDELALLELLELDDELLELDELPLPPPPHATRLVAAIASIEPLMTNAIVLNPM